jgi:hypothetical protein
MSGSAWFKFASRAKNKVVLITGTNEIAALAAVHFALAGYFESNFRAQLVLWISNIHSSFQRESSDW